MVTDRKLLTFDSFLDFTLVAEYITLTIIDIAFNSFLDFTTLQWLGRVLRKPNKAFDSFLDFTDDTASLHTLSTYYSFNSFLDFTHPV